MNVCSECGGVGVCEVGCAGPPTVKRINVAVNAEALAVIELVIRRENVSLTEAVRRLIGYGEVVYRAAKENDEAILIVGASSSREVVIL